MGRLVNSIYGVDLRSDSEHSQLPSELQPVPTACMQLTQHLESKNRPEEETEFFIVHGYWPEAAQVAQRIERSFMTRGLRTTIVLERTESTDG